MYKKLVEEAQRRSKETQSQIRETDNNSGAEVTNRNSAEFILFNEEFLVVTWADTKEKFSDIETKVNLVTKLEKEAANFRKTIKDLGKNYFT